MITRFLIVVLTVFVILWEVSSLKCYVCQNCPPDSGNYSEVPTKDNCSSCVIEDKFYYHKYLQTDRSCEICPQDDLVVENVNRSFYHCCSGELCMGSERDGLKEINRTAKIMEKQRTDKIKDNGKISNEIKDNSESTSEVKAQIIKPTAEPSTQNLESLSTTTQSTSVMNQENSTQRSDAANVPAGTAAANAPDGGESTTDPESRTNNLLGKATDVSAKEHLESPSIETHRTNALSPTPPTQSLDSAMKPNETITADTSEVGTREEETPERKKEAEDKVMEPHAETASQTLENVPTETDHSRVLNKEVPTQHLDSADMPNKAITSNPITVAGETGKIPVITSKTKDESLTPPAGSPTQNLESSSPSTCQLNIWYLVFPLPLICGLVDVSTD